MNIKNINDEISKFTTCKACRGRGGRYIVSKSKKKKQNTEVIFEKCSFCEGKGRVEDKRSREEKLDDWQNETNIWINCKDCDADGYIVDDDGNEFVCQTCEGYGVVKDKRTPEGREAERNRELRDLREPERHRRAARRDGRADACTADEHTGLYQHRVGAGRGEPQQEGPEGREG